MQSVLGAIDSSSEGEPSLVQWESHLVPRMHHAIGEVFKAAQAGAFAEHPPNSGDIHPNAGIIYTFHYFSNAYLI